MPKVSVIIPVYNVEPYLRQCIDSVIGQTLKDIEIILVDDGSTDNSGIICDDYATYDNRIRVIHKQNEGLSAARNDGIEAASAPFVMFVDSDDWVEPQFCEVPYKTAIVNDADLVLFSYKNVYRDGRITKAETQTRQGALSESEALHFNVYCSCYAWMGLYGRKLFDEVRYPIGMIHEDVGTAHRLIHVANRIYLIHDHLYYYRVLRPGSITATWGKQGRLQAKEMLSQKVEDLCEWGYEEYAEKDSLTLIERHGWRQADQKPFVEIVRKIKGLGPSEFDRKQRFLVALFKISPLLFDAVCIATRKRINLHTD